MASHFSSDHAIWVALKRRLGWNG